MKERYSDADKMKVSGIFVKWNFFPLFQRGIEGDLN
jgi:hypothetical protein